MKAILLSAMLASAGFVYIEVLGVSDPDVDAEGLHPSHPFGLGDPGPGFDLDR